jgi:Tol biopolymer transport system component
MTSPAMTALGMILGTAAYMSPEQAKGRPVDRRADVWAFGVVLYEMLTGSRLFGREDVSETLAAVLTSEPDLALLPAGTPIQIRQLLSRCLTKDKRQRLDSMAAARLDIEEALRAPFHGATAVPANRAGLWAIAAGLTLAAFVLGWFASAYRPGAPRSAPKASSIAAEIPPPPGVVTAFHDGFALSPDGETLAFVARNANGVQQLWTRRLDTAAARPLPGTEGALYPFWSPTGAHIAFFAGTQLRRVPTGGGDAQRICNVFGRFPLGSWGPSDEILFASSLGGTKSRIFKVPAAGGTPTAIESLGVAYRPTWLADGRKFIYAGGSGDTWGVYLAGSDGGTPTLITRLPNGAWPFAYAASGYLLMNRNDVLTVQRLDADTGTLTGPIATVSGPAGTPKGWMTLSSTADRIVALVAQQGNSAGGAGQPMATMQWVTRQGAPDGTLAEAGRYYTMALSRDGRRAAANLGNDIWIFDDANRKTRVTSRVLSLAPVWQVDDKALLFQRGGGVWRQAVDRETPAEELADSRGMATDWSADGRWILIGFDAGATSQRDIRLYDFHSRTSRDWLATEFNEQQGRFSTDGRWIAYTSDSSGQDEVYVRSFAAGGKAQPVSLGGGSHPRWRRDGRELYFLGPGDEMMAVTVTPLTSTIQIGEPKRLFTLPLNDITRSFVSPYDVTPDGQRFLLNRPDRPDSLFFLEGLAGVVGR